MAIFPFVARTPEAGETLVSSLRGDTFFKAGEVPSSALARLRAIFFNQLQALHRCDLVPLGEADKLVKEGWEADPLGAALEAGKRAGVFGVIIGVVYRFEERRGSAIGVQRPASVAFELLLLRVEDGEVLWHLQVDETQKSLSENLLKVGIFLKKGLRWVTAGELASEAMERGLRRFPPLKG